jgi:hypothetical protein
MKTTKVLLLGAVVTAFSFTAFAQGGAAAFLRAPILHDPVSTTPAVEPVTITYVNSSSALLSPRAQGNEIKVVKGVANDTNPALACRNTMIGSPKAVAECSSHTTMPACNPVTVAPLK